MLLGIGSGDLRMGRIGPKSGKASGRGGEGVHRKQERSVFQKDMLRGQIMKKGCSRWSATELGIGLEDQTWRNGGRGKNVQSKPICVPGQSEDHLDNGKFRWEDPLTIGGIIP